MNHIFVRDHQLCGWFIENRKNLEILGVATLCVVLSACTIGGGTASGPGMKASIAPREMSFSGVALGTPSPQQMAMLTNQGNADLTISSIAVTGSDFTESNNCGTTLGSGASCTISVTYTPAATGAVSGSIMITDDAIGSPQAVTLAGEFTGNGGGGGTQTCTGSSLPQTQTDVSADLAIGAGVTVTQLTSNGCNRFYYFDVPAYSASLNKIVYTNYVTDSGNTVLSANTDGTGAAVLMAGTGSQLFVSGDGTLAYFDQPVASATLGTSDIFGTLLASPATELQLTPTPLAPQPPLPVWQISSSSPDPAGGLDIAFSPDTLLHLVHVQADGKSVQPLPAPITLDDPESAGTFHRLRLNPKFPNILMYKRNVITGQTGATPELWLVDLNTCANSVCPATSIINVVANLKKDPTPLAGHSNWSPDGLDIAFSEPDIADYWIAQNVVSVVNSTATINQGFTLLELGPFSSMTSDYCVFPPDWPASTILACLAGPESTTNAKDVYLLSSDGLGTTKLLASTDAQVLTTDGTPMPRFAQDDTHILFNSDKTGGVQIYLISGFTLSVP